MFENHKKIMNNNTINNNNDNNNDDDNDNDNKKKPTNYAQHSFISNSVSATMHIADEQLIVGLVTDLILIRVHVRLLI